MVKLGSFASSVLCTAAVVSPVAAGSQGTYLWDPPADNEANVYSRVIELQHAGTLNGRLLATWEHWYTDGPTNTQPNGDPGNFIIRQSDDEGDSWTTLTIVNDTQKGPGHPYVRFWQPFFFEFPHPVGEYPEGTLLLVGNIVPYNKTITEFFTWRSMDHGRTWDPVGAWQRGGTTGAGIWEPFLYLDAQRNLVAVFSDERDAANHSQMLVHVVSEDGGDTWGEVVRDVMSSAQSDRPGMPTVALMDNGEYIMSYEICGRPYCPVSVKTSTDGVTWNAGDLGSSVVTPDGYYAGSSPYTVWDPSNKQLILGSRRARVVGTDTEALNTQTIVWTNSDYGKGEWSWSPAPLYVYNGSAACNSNYSPNLLPRSNGVIRYTASASQGTTGLCSERTEAAPVGVLPYQADFSTNGQAGWINFGGRWSICNDKYTVTAVQNADSRALTGSSGWTNYQISSDLMMSGSSGVAGLNARVTAPTNGINAMMGYMAAINTVTGNLTVSRVTAANGMVVLDSRAYLGGIQVGKWYHISITVRGSELTASLTSENSSGTTYTTTDNSFAKGMAGLLVKSGRGTFKNVEIHAV